MTEPHLISEGPALTRNGQASEPLRPCAAPKQATAGGHCNVNSSARLVTTRFRPSLSPPFHRRSS